MILILILTHLNLSISKRGNVGSAELQRRFSDNDDLQNSVVSLDELDVNKMMSLKNLGTRKKIKQNYVIAYKILVLFIYVQFTIKLIFQV